MSTVDHEITLKIKITTLNPGPPITMAESMKRALLHVSGVTDIEAEADGYAV